MRLVDELGFSVLQRFSELEHIERNPRFDREQHWAEIGNIEQTYGTLGRHWCPLIKLSFLLIQDKTFQFSHVR